MADEGAWCCIPVCINAESFGARVSKLPARDCKGDCVGDCIIKFDFFSSPLLLGVIGMSHQNRARQHTFHKGEHDLERALLRCFDPPSRGRGRCIPMLDLT